MFYKKKKTEGPKSKKTKGRLLQGGSTFDKNVQKWAGNVKIFWLPFDDLVFVSIAASSWKKYLENYPVYVMCGAHRRGRGRQGWNGIKKKTFSPTPTKHRWIDPSLDQTRLQNWSSFDKETTKLSANTQLIIVRRKWLHTLHLMPTNGPWALSQLPCQV